MAYLKKNKYKCNFFFILANNAQITCNRYNFICYLFAIYIICVNKMLN